MMGKEDGRQEESSLSIGANLNSKGIRHRARYVGRYRGTKDMKGYGMEVVQTKRASDSPRK
jgi:hypothetical protein